MTTTFRHHCAACCQGWTSPSPTSEAGELTNGDLLAAAEEAGFNVLVTADRNLRQQQNLAGRLIGLVVLSTNHWPVIRDSTALIVAAIGRAGTGRILEVTLPRPTLLRRPSPNATR